MQTVIVPICKNKNGDMQSDARKYTQSLFLLQLSHTLHLILAQRFEIYILSCISPFVATTGNQFGFK